MVRVYNWKKQSDKEGVEVFKETSDVQIKIVSRHELKDWS
jgi:hypothetical protein